MRILTSMISLCVLLVSTVSIANAQTNTRYTPNRRSAPSATVPLQSIHAEPVARPANEKASALVSQLVNNGTRFQLICRGGTELGISLTGGDTNIGSALSGWASSNPLIMEIHFNASPQAPDQTGRNLQPGQCSPAFFSLPGISATYILQQVSENGSVSGLKSLPAEIQLAAELKAQDQTDWRASSLRVKEYEDYMRSPDHFWSFVVVDSGQGYLAENGGSSDWHPEFSKPPFLFQKYDNKK